MDPKVTLRSRTTGCSTREAMGNGSRRAHPSDRSSGACPGPLALARLPPRCSCWTMRCTALHPRRPGRTDPRNSSAGVSRPAVRTWPGVHVSTHPRVCACLCFLRIYTNTLYYTSSEYAHLCIYVFVYIIMIIRMHLCMPIRIGTSRSKS